MPVIGSGGPAASEAAAPALAVRSDELQDVIEKVPSWITRWGIGIILALLLLVLWGSYALKYPDIVVVPLRLTTQNSPKSVNSRVEGKLVKLLVTNRQPVVRGARLAYLESTGNHEQVQHLDAWLGKLDRAAQTQSPAAIRQELAQQAIDYQNLGELQADFQIFDQARLQYQAFAAGEYYQQKQALLRQDLLNLTKQHATLQDQQRLYEQDVTLARQELAAQQQLFAQQVIAPLDFKQQQSRFLNRQLPLKQLETSLISSRKEQSAKRSELLDLQHLTAQQHSIFTQALRSMRSATASWQQKYVLTAPVAGVVFFASFLQERQLITGGQELFFVVPQSQREFCEVQIPQYNLGKVRTGQFVIIKFNSYPFQEFGVVRGQVDYISDISSKDGTFLARILLPKGLITTYNKKIAMRPGMKAKAEIITADMRLLEKLLYNFRKSSER
ncbi:HlyD family efflux transporter periplasmic adaptor subunit [Hymenobacter actinosclerus]|uniref:HlyD family secretion protein n=1 Tax=Hymenobacter actinosclerus TaxID=82805 RepID=A0A1I0IP50_9BACT|nr:HlyD family efflux transporter periplasmic adaptor subunit [Hymenobacter actinosclerus]SET98826.1 HlyD family secretion protein [Hymenobacter actinosclerus]